MATEKRSVPSREDLEVAVEILQRAGLEHLKAARWWSASSPEREDHAERAETIGRVVHFLRDV